ncbi:Protoporphyrinogen oxidase [Mycena kentingensis (nom. inval.)]|nr:Protoporphyrinogen oxidase [Mycena kentingensis (nom. inval.)]
MEIEAVPILRNESTSSASSTESDDSLLHTPADEHTLNFDLIDGALLAATPPKALAGLGHSKRSPRRVAVSRHFSLALEEANKSTEGVVLSQFAPRSGPDPRGYPFPEFDAYPDSPPPPNSSPEMQDLLAAILPLSERVDLEPPLPRTPECVDLQPVPPMTPETKQRPQQPEIVGDDQIITKTPRAHVFHPGLRRGDLFSPPPPPGPFVLEGESVEFTPRAQFTLRRRRGTVVRPLESIETEMEMAINSAPAETTPAGDIDGADNFTLETPAFPQPSVLFPVQLVAFPVYAALVGAVILLAPDQLSSIAFPATPSNAPQKGFGSLLRVVLALIFPFSAPGPSGVRHFAHWVSVAHLHVAIFLALLGVIAYLHLPTGALLVAGCVARMVQPGAWGAFSVPEAEEEQELGGDVREMLWRAVVSAPGSGLMDDEELKKVGGRYVVASKKREETRADVLRAGGLDSDEGSDGGDDE